MKPDAKNKKTPGPGESKVSKLRGSLAELKDELDQGWRDHWQDIKDYLAPECGLYLSSTDEDVNRGEKRRSKIINNAGGMSLRTLASGLHGGLTSPSRPWFRLALGDLDLMEFTPVKIWLTQVRDILLRLFARSNFYPSVHALYKELGAFGTAAMLIEEDFDSVIRCRPFTIGEYMLALDSKYRPDTMFRRVSMTARQMVQAFGEDKVSSAVKTAYTTANRRQQRFNVIHVIRPKEDADVNETPLREMEYESVYFEEKGSDEDALLRTSGYRGMPFVAPRWGATGVDTYGRGPGMMALPDVKQLQRMEKDKLKGLAKMVDPPMKATGMLKPAGGNVVPGGITFVDGTGGLDGYGPLYQIDLRLAEIMHESDRVVTRVQQAFFNDLFLSILQQEKTMTAREVAERHDEKLLMLGPTLERLHSEFLSPAIDRTFNIAENFGLIPEAPPDLEGRELRIEYVSVLAQAQKLVGLSAVEQVSGFVGNLSAVIPDVLDALDADEAVEEYAAMLGVPPKIIRGPDEREALREQRRQQEAAQAALDQGQNVAAMAQGAKTLSEVKAEGNPVMESLIPGM